ncbi:hypothetical protein [Psychrobacter urativorans]|uniref:Uncharacterized protein n=1 Tax=Psychrobacter urativorans TaxID=45610 RepID=A0A0M4TVN7_9GAMM|nr:hypothetical protein [Psychrobacter urativorans]ALF59999.1 hypothetical protein AOC03_08050 [Psychrobacter urativorans]
MSTLLTTPFKTTVKTTLKHIVAATLMSSCLCILSACDAQKITSASTVGSNNIAQTTPEIINRNSMQAETSDAPFNTQTLSPSGYKGLHFGQTITPEVLSRLGLIKGEHGYDECYYLEDPTKASVKRDDTDFEPIYYQVIDGKLALIGLNAPDINFYTGIRSGDKVDKIISAHPNNLRYSMDKYDETGDYYHFIYDIPAKANTLSLQIKYTMRGGKKIANANSMTQPVDKWSAAQRAQLQGQVETIELGIPDAIMLVEGCS